MKLLKKREQQNENSTLINSPNGTVFIVDISGYSHFVRETKHQAGAAIIAGLLNAIIDANKLSLRISEIEGDAILFYRYGPAYPVDTILEQFELMLEAFNAKIESLKTDFPQVGHLSIKLVVHYGEISGFSVRGFDKLYGQVLVEVHRLLKNEVHLHTYALITEDYIKAQASAHNQREGSRQCEIYDSGTVCYTYFPYPEKDIPNVYRGLAYC
jgi:hypothetical protein